MTKQTTKKQHFTPRFYLKRFAIDNQLQTLDIKNGRLIKPQSYTGVCYADFFYSIETGKKDEISQAFEELFGKIEDEFAKEYDDIVDAIWGYRPLTDQQLDILAWFMASLWIRSPRMRDQINKSIEDSMKQIISLNAEYPSFIDGFRKVLAKEGREATDEQIESARKTLTSGAFKYISTNNVNHLNMIIDCEKYQRWFYIKKWRFYLAKGSKRFITSDTPVIEVYNKEGTIVEQMYNNHIAQRRHYFALTPKILIELTDPLKPGKKQKRHAIFNNKDWKIVETNRLIANYSKDYAYASDREYLEDLLRFYQGAKPQIPMA